MWHSQIAAIFLELVPRSVEQWCPWEWVRTKKRKLVACRREWGRNMWYMVLSDFGFFLFCFDFCFSMSVIISLRNCTKRKDLPSSSYIFYGHNQEKSWQSKHPGCCTFLSIYQKHLTLLVTRAFLISCRLMELTIRSFIGLLIICFLERNQSNSKVFCQTPIPYFLEFHREVYWDRYCLLPILGPIHLKTIVNANASKRIHVFLSPSTRKRSSFT